MMLSSCHMNTVCKQCDRERESDRREKERKEKDRERGERPQALLLHASPGTFSVKLFAHSLWCWVPGPVARDGAPPHYPPSQPHCEHLWQFDRQQRLRGGGKQNQEQQSLIWIQAGHSSLVETLHHFLLDLQPTAHRWKMDWERGRGQTGRRTNSGRTQHLTAQSQSHRELGYRDWRCFYDAIII